MRKHILVVIISFIIGQCSTFWLHSALASQLVLNHEFSPIVATERLNKDYNYTLLFSDGKRKIYFIQSLQERKQWYPDYNIIGVYDGSGGIRNIEFIPNKTPLTPLDADNLKLVYPFYPPGADMDIRGKHTTSRTCSLQIFPKDDYLLLFLEQRFSAGGSGGQHDGIARKYLVITQEKVYISTDFHIITYFSLSFPRHYGVTWRAGYMGYAHCYDLNVSFDNDTFTVSCTKQEFRLEDLFETPEMVEHSQHKPLNGFWGEFFVYNEFSVPREPIYKYSRETQTFHLETVE